MKVLFVFVMGFIFGYYTGLHDVKHRSTAPAREPVYFHSSFTEHIYHA